MKNQKVLKLTLIALMSSVLCLLAPISIPIPFSTVPISCATFAVYLCAGVLGPKLGSASVIIYILLGLVGLPVYAGWSSGASVIAGPTGGYLIGYLVISFCTGIFAHKTGKSTYGIVLGMLIGTLGCYVIGTAWLSLQLNLGFKGALTAGVLPFLLGDILKIIVATIILQPLRIQVLKYLSFK